MNETKQAESLAAILQSRALSQPDYPIFTYLADGETEEMPLTYAEFDRKARWLAAALQARQLQGERVLLLFPQGLDYLVALFGCFYAGAIAVPAYPPRNNRNMLRIEAIAENSQAAAILADKSSVDRMVKMKREFTKQPLLSYEEMIAARAVWTPHNIKPDDIAYLQYTSGSTGNPKGVIIRHINVLTNAEICRDSYPDDTRRAVNWIPMFHDMGLIFMMSYLLQNAQCYFMSPVNFVQKPFRWLKAISHYQADFTVAPNFAFDLCYEKITDEQLQELDLHCLRSALSGSERVQLATLLNFHERFKGCGFRMEAFTPAYGLAEATLVTNSIRNEGVPRITPKDNPGEVIAITQTDLQFDYPEHYHVSNGPASRGGTVRIVDPETKAVKAAGEEGEIWISFPGSIATGYWQNEEATQETFLNYLEGEPGIRYLRTSDLGFLLEGELYITGRIKDIIIIRGRNYYPIDIEYTVASAHPALQSNSGAAFYVEEDGKEQLAIVHEVRRAEWRSANPDEVIENIRQAIAEAFELSPVRIVLIFPMSLPKTSSGKVQRQKAKQYMLEGKLRVMKEWQWSNQELAPDPELTPDKINEEKVLRWLRQKIAQKAQMPLEAIKPSSAFNDYPLDSVEAAEMAEEMTEELGFQVEAESFWAMPSIEALAAFLAERHQAAKGR